MRFGAVILVLMMGASAAPVRAVEPPAWLPRYDLDIRIDTAKCLAIVKQRVTFINRHQRPASDLVFNAHARYTIPDDQIGFMAKMAEMLRIAPKEGFYFDGPPLVVQEIGIVEGETIIQPAAHGAKEKRRTCDYRYGDKNPCTIVVPLERPVGAGESVTV